MSKNDEACKKCEEKLGVMIRDSPLITFLLHAIDSSPFCKRPLISCKPCVSSDGASSYDPDTNHINICYDANLTKIQMRDSLSHELLHAYDVCRIKFDKNSCTHVACAEVRAANLSGECRPLREFLRLKILPPPLNYDGSHFRGHHMKCVKRRVHASLKESPACSSSKIDEVLESVFKSCLSDTAPFIDVPYSE